MIYIFINGDKLESNEIEIEFNNIDHRIFLLTSKQVSSDSLSNIKALELYSEDITVLLSSILGFLLSKDYNYENQYIIVDNNEEDYQEAIQIWGSQGYKISFCNDIKGINSKILALLLSGYYDNEAMSCVIKDFTYTEIKNLLRIENKKGLLTLFNLLVRNKKVSDILLKYVNMLIDKNYEQFLNILELRRIEMKKIFRKVCSLEA